MVEGYFSFEIRGELGMGGWLDDCTFTNMSVIEA